MLGKLQQGFMFISSAYLVGMLLLFQVSRLPVTTELQLWRSDVTKPKRFRYDFHVQCDSCFQLFFKQTCFCDDLLCPCVLNADKNRAIVKPLM